MLCESRLWSMTFTQLEEVNPLPSTTAPQTTTTFWPWKADATRMSASTRHTALIHHSSPDQRDSSKVPGVRPGRGASERRVVTESGISPLSSRDLQRPQRSRQSSAEMEIPWQDQSAGDVCFLVPSSCQSICQNYSDLHIGGDQVLPLYADDGKLLPCNETQAIVPFLQSCDVPPAAVAEPPPEKASQAGPLLPRRGGSAHWRRGSGRDWSVIIHGSERPFSNSLLNCYLEHKLMDLYQQYMVENMAREGCGGGGATCPLLGSELVLTSLDQITLQLSREGNLEAGMAKDMVLSCLLRVASDMQSSEISTPFLQISTEASKEPNSDASEEQPQHEESQESLIYSDFPVKDIL